MWNYLTLVPDHTDQFCIGVPGTWRWSDGSYGSSLHILRICCVYMESHKFPALSEYQHIWCAGLETLYHGQKGMKKRKREMWSRNWAEAYIHLVYISWTIDRFCVLVLWSRRFWWCRTLEENQASITRKKSWWIPLWFTSGAENENSLYRSRPCKPTVHAIGRPLKSIGKPISRWQTTEKVKLKSKLN